MNYVMKCTVLTKAHPHMVRNLKNQMCSVLKSWVISYVSFELKPNISKISTVSIIRVHVVNDHTLAICQIDASSCWLKRWFLIQH
jgi:hypothetical protein